ncbi:hypothetical protein PF008_g6174 [Phytophthora fragariae]|uniref:Polycystin cation channel PKD1/PKD2 domain-containing protein n=1 Tax=Phytophthora fragariae TaxID=53985 RepID=A0A6G0S671_9STRA|nr:hypothetical protein PF008_g6174 [Phytophthora fragariae]
MPWTDMYVILSPDPCTAVKKKDPPPPTISVHDALDVLWHDSHHAWDLRRIVMALFSFAIFIAAVFVHVPTRTMYTQSHAVLSALATSGGDTVTDDSPVKFLNIEAIPDILDWINDTFVPQVFVTEDAYGETLPGDEWGRVAMFNQVLGGVSFDVTQMDKRDCKTEAFLPRDILAEKGEWLNASTKELVITVPTLNSEIPGFVVTTLKLDFKAGGYIKPSFTSTPTLADHFPSTHRIVIDALIVLWFSPWMLIMTITTYAIRRYKTRRGTINPVKFAHQSVMEIIRKCTLPDGWMAINVLRGPMVHAFYVTVLITHFAITDEAFMNKIEELQNGSRSGDNALRSLIASFNYIARLSVLSRILASAAVFIQGLRVLNTFRNHNGLSVLSRSITKAIYWCGAFAVTFFVIFMAFAVSGAILFGNRVHEFSSLLVSMTTCVNMLFGEFDFGVISDIHYSVAFYWSFMVLETFVLLNIVLAIVIDAYNAEKLKKERTKWWRCRRVFVNMMMGFTTKAIDLLPRCCLGIKPRHDVVLWGRIRTKRLRQELLSRLNGSQDVEHGCELTPGTVLTVEKLGQLFPEATEIECGNTLKYLVAGICHTAEEDESEEDDCGKPDDRVSLAPCQCGSFGKSKLDSPRSFESAMNTGVSTISIRDSNRSTPTTEIQEVTTRIVGVEEKLEQINLALQQKIDMLLERMAQA